MTTSIETQYRWWTCSTSIVDSIRYESTRQERQCTYGGTLSQYRKLRPTPEEMQENRPRALLRFAGRAVLDGVHEKNRQWTWAHFAERRDDRHAYVDLFKKKQLNTSTPQVYDPEHTCTHAAMLKHLTGCQSTGRS